VAVLVNPLAGGGRAARLVAPVLDRLRARGIQARLVLAPDPAQARDMLRTLVAENHVEATVVVGGDGTVHAALLSGDAPPLGIVPVGSGNDIAAALDTPTDPLDAVDAVVRAVRAGAIRRIDLGHVLHPDGPGTLWGGVLCAGFDSAVNARANRLPGIVTGRRYELATLAELPRLAPRTMRLTLDGAEYVLPVTLVAVGNTAAYGGGLRICPDADPADGMFDVTVVGPISRIDLLRVFPKVATGGHLGHPAVRTYRASEVRLVCAGVTAYADGEPVSPLPVRIRCEPGALAVLDLRATPSTPSTSSTPPPGDHGDKYGK
jgi:diacylglycerol kinase (ATP)